MAKKEIQSLNPFFLSPMIPEANFCDRKDETETLKRYVSGGSNVLLMSPRRMGKSGLIHHLFGLPEFRKGFHTFFIDIYETSSLEEFIQKLGREIVGKLSRKGFSAVRSFLKSLGSLRGVFSMDPTSGMPSFSVGIGEIVQPETTLDEIFSYLEHADKPCIVAIDEFQKVADYEQNNVEAILRSRIQLLRNTQFIFSGSERSILSQMFGSASRPFYQSTSVMSLGPIDSREYADFAVKMFNLYGKELDREAVHDLYDLVQGYTYYLQQALHASFSLLPSGQTCDKTCIFNCIDDTLTAHTDYFQELLSALTPNQRALLLAIAREGRATNIASSDFVNRYGLGSVSSVQSAARSLLKRQLITRNPGKEFYLDDKYMELWLIRPFGITPAVRLEQNRARGGE